MKLYISTNKRRIGVVLADEKTVYFKKCFLSTETFPDSAMIQGLKRGLILATNLIRKPKIDVISDDNSLNHPSQQRALQHDDMVKRYNNISYSEKTDKDEYFLKICRNMINFEEMRERNGRNYTR